MFIFQMREPILRIKAASLCNFGMTNDSKGYRLLDPNTKTIVVIRDVNFNNMRMIIAIADHKLYETVSENIHVE